MIRKILLTVTIVVFSGGLLGCWFYFVGQLSSRGLEQNRCTRVEVLLLDSLESEIVDREEICDQLIRSFKGKSIMNVNLDSIERAVRARGEVMAAEVFRTDRQTLSVHIIQRKPVVRFESGHGHWYSDPEGYLFPVTNSVDVPVVTGILPFQVQASYRGHAPEDARRWVEEMAEMAQYIDRNPVLRREIGQLEVDPSGDIRLYTRTPGPTIIFGPCGDYATKFRKLAAWWEYILPHAGENRYKTINLKYNNQIICKQT